MDEYNTKFVSELRKIYRAIIARMVNTGRTEESDVLFIEFYINYVEKELNKES